MHDLISRKAALDALGDEPEVWTGKDEYAMGLNNQWHYDRNAILRCPSAQPETEKRTSESVQNVPNGELISRKAAIDALIEWYGCEPSDIGAFENIVEKLPSAQPQRIRGKWILVDSFSAYGGDEVTWMAHGNPIAFHYCSVCKEQAYANEDGDEILSKFCPNCGADMRGGENALN